MERRVEEGRRGRVEGKVALITGAGQGMGASHASLLAREGAACVLTDIDVDAVRRQAEALRAEGLAASHVEHDVTSLSSWQKVIDAAESEFGSVSVLVNNAGVSRPHSLEEETDEGWARVIAINQTGVMLGMKVSVPSMRRAGGGSIVNIASVSGFVGQPGTFSYQASKGAVRQLTKAAAMQYATEGIRVNAVCPGVIETPLLAGATEQTLNRRLAQTPMGRFGTPLEVSYCVLFLASDESSYVTGIDLLVDGGLVAN